MKITTLKKVTLFAHDNIDSLSKNGRNNIYIHVWFSSCVFLCIIYLWMYQIIIVFFVVLCFIWMCLFHKKKDMNIISFFITLHCMKVRCCTLWYILSIKTKCTCALYGYKQSVQIHLNLFRFPLETLAADVSGSD